MRNRSVPVLLLAFVAVLFTIPGVAKTDPPVEIKQALATSGIVPDAAGSLCLKSKNGRTKFCLRASGLDAKATYYLVINDTVVKQLTSSAKGTLTIKALPQSAPDWADIWDLVICDSSMSVVLDAFGATDGGPTDSGSMTVSGGSMTVTGSYVGYGGNSLALTYLSDSTVSIFTNGGSVTLGSMSGGSGDLFDFSGSLSFFSTNSTGLDLTSSSVTFSDDDVHTNAISGTDLGTGTDFSYGTLTLGDSADMLFLESGLICSNVAYVGWLDLTDTNTIATLIAPTELNIYYLSGDGSTTNAYLQDQTYQLDPTATTDPAAP